jgi:hypothetical protein
VRGGHSAPNSRHISIFTDAISLFIYAIKIVMRANRATMLGAFFVGCLGVDRCGLGVGCVLVLVSWSAGL